MDSTILSLQEKQLKLKIIKDILEFNYTRNPQPIIFQKIIYCLLYNQPDYIISIYGIENGVILYNTPVVMKSSKVFDLNTLFIETLIKIKQELEFFQNQEELKNQKSL